MERQGDESSFRVVDRRRFRPDGEPVSGEAAAGEAAVGGAGPAAEGESAGQAAQRQQARARAEAPLAPATFASLVSSLAVSAVAALGLSAESPEGGSPGRPDLPLARHSIDLLGMLEEKTRGNLTPDEARLLEQTLFELRMLVVRASSRPG